METLIPHDLFLELLRQTFGARVELGHTTVSKQRHDYLVLLVQLRRPALKVVIKLAGPEAPLASAFDRTAMLHRLVAAYTSIPMPEVLAVNMAYQPWPWRYFIRTYIPGREWAVVRPKINDTELADARRQIGEAVAQLHMLHFPAFGDLMADGSIQGDAACLVGLKTHAQAIIKSAPLQDLFFAALESRRQLFIDDQQASLCHEDLHKYNLLFQHRAGRWQLATILDFDKAWAGPHESDLARMELWQDTMGKEFWEAYEAIYPVNPLYPQRRPVYQLLWCLECAWPTPEHLADTQGLCAELGLPRLEHFE
jgi:aminoglycoside phosphotransferase (APT) family kinase protein